MGSVQVVKKHDDPDLVVLATDECLFADEGFRSVAAVTLTSCIHFVYTHKAELMMHINCVIANGQWSVP